MFRLNDLAKVIPESILLGDRNIEWENISIDSRTIKSGELFFALRGEKYDGHQFIRSACQKGAGGVVLEKIFFQNHQLFPYEYKRPFLLVDNSLVALQLWARHYQSLFKTLNICITGSNGKTTTKEIIAHLLTPKYHVLKSQGNYNNEIGVPLTLLGLAPYHKVLVMEMAAQKLGEIKELTNIVKPDIAIVTNIGEAHIGLFESRDNIAKEKSEIMVVLKDKGTAILNRDDEYFTYLRNRLPRYIDVISIGFHMEAQLRVVSFKQEREKGIHFDLLLQGGKIHHIFMPMLGKFNVYNALAAIAVGIKMNISIDEMIQGISSFKSSHMNMECLAMNRGITLIQDYYNANPTAMKEALNSVASISEERFKVAVLGDMLELGNQAPDYHEAVGRIVASLPFDLLITLGEYGTYIGKGAQENGMAKDRIYYFNREDKDKLTIQLMDSVPDNSIVLLKGSRGMQMEDIVRYWVENDK
jgi:UDP-N-acetylmuramoyl-tripeptide--D-alanyl-D-alanine ligase